MEAHKEMYCLIRTWEIEIKEDFFDENELIAKMHTLVFWLFGKGYISKKQFNYWIDRLENEKYGLSFSELFYDDFTNEMCVLYSIIDINDDSSDELDMVTYLMSELLSSLGIYINRIKEIFKEYEIEFSVPNCWRVDFEEEFDEVSERVNKLLISR